MRRETKHALKQTNLTGSERGQVSDGKWKDRTIDGKLFWQWPRENGAASCGQANLRSVRKVAMFFFPKRRIIRSVCSFFKCVVSGEDERHKFRNFKRPCTHKPSGIILYYIR